MDTHSRRELPVATLFYCGKVFVLLRYGGTLDNGIGSVVQADSPLPQFREHLPDAQFKTDTHNGVLHTRLLYNMVGHHLG